VARHHAAGILYPHIALQQGLDKIANLPEDTDQYG
jgi:hypothetical protein